MRPYHRFFYNLDELKAHKQEFYLTRVAGNRYIDFKYYGFIEDYEITVK